MTKEVYQTEENRRKTKKMLLYFAIFSIVMLFAGLTSAYIVSQADGFWVKIRLPIAFTVSTILIVTSSVTMYAAVKAVRNGKMAALKNYLLFTLILGMLFSLFQYQGWKELFYRGHTFRGENIFMLKGEYGKDYSFFYKGKEVKEVDGEYYAADDQLHEKPLKDAIMGSRDVSSSYLIALTVVHLLHLFGGLLYLIYVYRDSVKNRLSAANSLKVELCSIYWHFLGGLWIYLFLFLLFIH